MIFFILRKMFKYKMVCLLFLIVHISANFALDGPKFRSYSNLSDVSNIHVEGTVSQIFYVGLSFYFM